MRAARGAVSHDVIMMRANQEAADGVAGPTLTLAEFSHWLLSPANDIFNAEHDQLCDDMTHPLSAYWINSSHNTCVFTIVFADWSGVPLAAKCGRHSAVHFVVKATVGYAAHFFTACGTSVHFVW
jgi:hypothetical protein